MAANTVPTVSSVPSQSSSAPANARLGGSRTPPIAPTAEGGVPAQGNTATRSVAQVYLDCNATTPTSARAAQAALSTMQACFGNPSSTHMTGLQAKHLLENARGAARAAVGGDPADEIVFTSGATEAIQMAVFSALQHGAKLLRQCRAANAAQSTPLDASACGKDLLLYGATEHKAVPQALHHWREILDLPLSIEAIPVDEAGQYDLAFLREKLPRCAFLATMAVNNETGVISPLEDVARLLAETGSDALWLVDGVQALGKVPLRLAGGRIDYVTFSGHKLYAPKGVGFLYAKRGAPIVPLIVGGGQERGIRSGTENLPGVAAFGEVLREIARGPGGPTGFADHDTLVAWRDALVAALVDAFPGVAFNTPFAHAVPTTINFSLPGFASRELLDLFDAVGLRLSAGSACNSAKAVKSHVLDAMAIPEWRSLSAIRMSFGPATTAEEIERGVRAVAQAARALRESCAMPQPRRSQGVKHAKTDGVVHFPAGTANSWVVTCAATGVCVVIDPCEENAERIVHFVECQGLRTLAVLDTHLHADHSSPRAKLEEILEVKGTRDGLGFPSEGVELEIVGGASCLVLPLRPGPATPPGVPSPADLDLVCAPTPGHTSESVSFLLREKGQPRYLFSGDLVLPGGLGRTNFPTSDAAAMFESLRWLDAVVPATCVICTAHDYSNSFASLWRSEKASNPLLELVLDTTHPLSRPMFLAAKREYDQGLRDAEEKAQGIVCGVVKCDSDPASEVAIPPGRLAEWLAREGGNLRVIDVREPWEWNVSGGWEEFGFDAPPPNVPLSRFVNLIGELLATERGLDTPVALLCRSGARSLHAARSLRRLGFRKAWSLEGGFAYGLA